MDNRTKRKIIVAVLTASLLLAGTTLVLLAKQ